MYSNDGLFLSIDIGFKNKNYYQKSNPSISEAIFFLESYLVYEVYIMNNTKLKNAFKKFVYIYVYTYMLLK